MKFFKCKQEETKVAPAEDHVLVTEGVSTCICILMMGEINGKAYLAMYHWEGLPSSFNKQSACISNELRVIVFCMIDKLKRAINIQFRDFNKPQLYGCYCIGGEQANLDSLGLLLSSGTELEVLALRTYIVHACDYHFNITPSTVFKHANYLTSGTFSLRITFSKDSIQLHDNSTPEDELLGMIDGNESDDEDDEDDEDEEASTSHVHGV